MPHTNHTMDLHETYPLPDPLWNGINGYPLPSFMSSSLISLFPDPFADGPVVLPENQRALFTAEQTDVLLNHHPNSVDFPLRHVDSVLNTIDSIAPTQQLYCTAASNDISPDPSLENVTRAHTNTTPSINAAIPTVPEVPVELSYADGKCDQTTISVALEADKSMDVDNTEYDSIIHTDSRKKSMSCQNPSYFVEKTGGLLNCENNAKEQKNSKDQKLTEDEIEEILKVQVAVPLPPLTETRSLKKRYSETMEHDSRSGCVSNHSAISRGETKVSKDFFFVTYDVKNPLVCPYCEQKKYFPFEDCLEQHIRKKHEIKAKKRPYKRRKQTREYKCEECNAEMKNAVNLRRHKDNAHGGEITDTCSFCGAKFSSKPSYVIHRRDQHGVVPESVRERFGEAVYEERARKKKSEAGHKDNWTVHRCSSCNYWSDCKANTERHIKLSHLDIREVPCNLCELRFQTKSNMQIHRATVHRQRRDEEEKRSQF